MSNIKFEYFYRDASNYKNFGYIVFHEEQDLNLEEETKTLKKILISQQYFAHREFQVPPLFFPEPFTDDDHGWHEFDCLSFTEEEVTEDLGWREWVFNLIKVGK